MYAQPQLLERPVAAKAFVDVFLRHAQDWLVAKRQCWCLKAEYRVASLGLGDHAFCGSDGHVANSTVSRRGRRSHSPDCGDTTMRFAATGRSCTAACSPARVK